MIDINREIEDYTRMLMDFLDSGGNNTSTKSIGQKNEIKEFYNYLKDKRDFTDCLEEYFS